MGPLNISVKGEYALEAVLDLAIEGSDSPVKIASIAKRRKIPQKFLELILAGLKQGGFVVSRRGAQGGYKLARDPDQITVGEVLRFVEGTRTSKVVVWKTAETPFTNMWKQINEAVSAILDNTTFAEVARQWREKQSVYVPDWNI